MGLDFDAVYDFIFSLVVICRTLICLVLFALVVLIFLWKNRPHKFEFASIKFHVDQLVHKLAYCFPIPIFKVLNFKSLDVWQTKLFEVTDQLGYSFFGFALKVFEINKYSLFFSLN